MKSYFKQSDDKKKNSSSCIFSDKNDDLPVMTTSKYSSQSKLVLSFTPPDPQMKFMTTLV